MAQQNGVSKNSKLVCYSSLFSDSSEFCWMLDSMPTFLSCLCNRSLGSCLANIYSHMHSSWKRWGVIIQSVMRMRKGRKFFFHSYHA